MRSELEVLVSGIRIERKEQKIVVCSYQFMANGRSFACLSTAKTLTLLSVRESEFGMVVNGKPTQR